MLLLRLVACFKFKLKFAIENSNGEMHGYIFANDQKVKVRSQ